MNPKNADDESGLITPAWKPVLPLRFGIATCPAGKLPVMNEGVKISRKGVLLTAYGNNPDGGGKLLRVWEQSGESGLCEISLPVKERWSGTTCEFERRSQWKSSQDTKWCI